MVTTSTDSPPEEIAAAAASKQPQHRRQIGEMLLRQLLRQPVRCRPPQEATPPAATLYTWKESTAIRTPGPYDSLWCARD